MRCILRLAAVVVSPCPDGGRNGRHLLQGLQTPPLRRRLSVRYISAKKVTKRYSQLTPRASHAASTSGEGRLRYIVSFKNCRCTAPCRNGHQHHQVEGTLLHLSQRKFPPSSSLSVRDCSTREAQMPSEDTEGNHLDIRNSMERFKRTDKLRVTICQTDVQCRSDLGVGG